MHPSEEDANNWQLELQAVVEPMLITEVSGSSQSSRRWQRMDELHLQKDSTNSFRRFRSMISMEIRFTVPWLGSQMPWRNLVVSGGSFELVGIKKLEGMGGNSKQTGGMGAQRGAEIRAPVPGKASKGCACLPWDGMG